MSTYSSFYWQHMFAFHLKFLRLIKSLNFLRGWRLEILFREIMIRICKTCNMEWLRQPKREFEVLRYRLLSQGREHVGTATFTHSRVIERVKCKGVRLTFRWILSLMLESDVGVCKPWWQRDRDLSILAERIKFSEVYVLFRNPLVLEPKQIWSSCV